VMLPKPNVPFPSRTHNTELTFSGSPVARGSRIKEIKLVAQTA
jgi:hypothetical protein